MVGVAGYGAGEPRVGELADPEREAVGVLVDDGVVPGPILGLLRDLHRDAVVNILGQEIEPWGAIPGTIAAVPEAIADESPKSSTTDNPDEDNG